MKKVFRNLTLLMVSASLFMACSSDKDDFIDPYIPEATESEVAEEIANVVKALKDIDGKTDGADVSEFIAILESSDLTAKTNEFTVFAVENAVNADFDEPENTSRHSAIDTRGSKYNMYYHMLAGKIDVRNIKADKDYVYKTINGKNVIISKRNNIVYVNGVPMKKNEFFGNRYGKGSHIYCVKNPIPEKEESINSDENKKNAYDIQVFNIVDGKEVVSKDAIVMAFELDGYKQNLIAKVRANDDGLATIIYKGSKPLYYKAMNKQYSYIYNGFMVAGMYTSKNIKNALPYDNVRIKGQLYEPAVGKPILADMNGDGKINYQDKQGKKFLELKKNETTNNIYLADKSK